MTNKDEDSGFYTNDQPSMVIVLKSNNNDKEVEHLPKKPTSEDGFELLDINDYPFDLISSNSEILLEPESSFIHKSELSIEKSNINNLECSERCLWLFLILFSKLDCLRQLIKEIQIHDDMNSPIINLMKDILTFIKNKCDIKEIPNTFTDLSRYPSFAKSSWNNSFYMFITELESVLSRGSNKFKDMFYSNILKITSCDNKCTPLSKKCFIKSGLQIILPEAQSLDCDLEQLIENNLKYNRRKCSQCGGQQNTEMQIEEPPNLLFIHFNRNSNGKWNKTRFQSSEAYLIEVDGVKKLFKMIAAICYSDSDTDYRFKFLENDYKWKIFNKDGTYIDAIQEILSQDVISIILKMVC